MIEKQLSYILVALTILPNLFGVILGLLGVTVPISLLGLIVAIIVALNIKVIPTLQSKCSKNVFGLLLLFLLYFMSTYLYTCSKTASVEKLWNIAYLLLSPLIIIWYAYRKKHNDVKVEASFVSFLGKYSNLILFFLGLLMVLGFTVNSKESEDRHCIIGMIDSIWCSRYTGFIAIIPILKIFQKKWCKWDIIAIISALYIMMKSGSRGPILALLVSICYFVFPKVKLKYKIYLCVFSALIVCIFLFFSERSMSGSSESSDLERIALIQGVLDAKFDIFWGVGVGGYNVFLTGEDSLYYPHNLFLEAYIEAGVLAIIFLTGIIICAFRRRMYTYFTCFTIYFFINSMLSGDITGNNYLIIFIGVLLLSRRYNIRKKDCICI